MTYTAFGGTKPRLAVATSRDLVHWTKAAGHLRQGGGRSLRGPLVAVGRHRRRA